MNRCLNKNQRLALFQHTNGFLNANPETLFKTILRRNLPQKEDTIIVEDTNLELTRVLFTSSFYHLLTGIQYFMSFLYMNMTTLYHSQSLLLWYYSIFFAELSFLEMNLKSFITIDEKYDEKKGFSRIRRKIWLGTDIKSKIPKYQLGKFAGQQHVLIAKWFFNLLTNKTCQKLSPSLAVFAKENIKFFTDFRNQFNYALELQLDELYRVGDKSFYPLDDSLEYVEKIHQLIIGEYEEDLDNVMPEEFWAVEHINILCDCLLPLVDTINPPPEIKFHLSLIVKFYKDSPFLKLIYELLGDIIKASKIGS